MSTALTKQSLENRVDNLQTKVQEAAAVTNQMLVGGAVAFGSGVVEAKMPNMEIFGMPVIPSAGATLAVAALMGVGGKRSRRTMLSAASGLLYPWLRDQGKKMGK